MASCVEGEDGSEKPDARECDEDAEGEAEEEGSSLGASLVLGQRFLRLSLGVAARLGGRFVMLEAGFSTLAPSLDEDFEGAFDEQRDYVKNPELCVNGGGIMYRRGGVKTYQGLGGSLSP